ncbi:MAG: DUF488 domain-containing protein [Thermomicrobiales bacterium]
MTGRILTVGYGARTIDEFIDLLQEYAVEYLIDVRVQPYSSYKPEFSREPLSASLVDAGMRYVHMGEQLGGRPEDDRFWIDDRKVDYEQVRDLPNYRQGIERLVNASEQQHAVCLMCSEGRPEECHRSKLVGESLVERGIPVFHIDADGDLRPHSEIIRRLTKGQMTFDFAPPRFTSKALKRNR